MNRISITGRLAADSEMRYTTGGDPILNFRIADDVGYGDKKTTNWWQCSIFGKRASESLAGYLKKGQQVAVWGQAVMREWTDRDGQKRLASEIRVDELELIGQRQESEPAKPKGRGESSLSGIADSDIPF